MALCDSHSGSCWLYLALALSSSLLLYNFTYTVLDRLSGPLLGSQRRCHADALCPGLVSNKTSPPAMQWVSDRILHTQPASRPCQIQVPHTFTISNKQRHGPLARTNSQTFYWNNWCSSPKKCIFLQVEFSRSWILYKYSSFLPAPKLCIFHPWGWLMLLCTIIGNISQPPCYSCGWPQSKEIHNHKLKIHYEEAS